MPAFFITSQDIADDHITITGDLLRHLRGSLRLKVEETLLFTDDRRKRYQTVVTELSRERLNARILSATDAPPESGPAMILGQALLKGDHMDWVVQKATELGVETIVPIIAHRSVVRPDPHRTASQTARWQRIAREAAQQSEQWRVPIVCAPRMAQAFFTATDAGTRLILSERMEGESLLRITLPTGPNASLVLAVGPEGGWEAAEVGQARAQNFQPTTLGSTILRSETAALTGVAVLQSRLGRLG